MSYIMAEQQADGYWTVQTEFLHLGCGTMRHTAIMRARDAYPSVMQRFPLQREEIPGELREIARRMLAVGRGVEGCKDLESGWPTAGSMLRWAESVAAWADELEAIK
jgi:hypothetical protein